MTYYILEHPADTPETGSEFPQVQKMAPGYDYDAPNSVYQLSEAHSQLPSFEPNLDYLVLAGKAKPTDLLSVAVLSGGLLVSEKFKSLLEKFSLPTHKFYPANVKTRKGMLQYYWMHIICNLSKEVNFPKTRFFVHLFYRTALGYAEVSSYEDYVNQQKDLVKNNPGKTIALSANDITIPASSLNGLDLFRIGTFNTNLFISEALQKAMINEKITGCEIKPAPGLMVE